MKRVLRSFFINFVSFWLISSLLSAIDFSGRMEILILASLLLAIVDLVVKPFLNLVLLPLNLVTLGAFRWIINVIVIYLVTLLIPEFKVKSFIFPGIQLYGFIVPPLHFNLFWTYILISFILSLISNLTYSLFK